MTKNCQFVKKHKEVKQNSTNILNGCRYKNKHPKAFRRYSVGKYKSVYASYFPDLRHSEGAKASEESLD